MMSKCMVALLLVGLVVLLIVSVSPIELPKYCGQLLWPSHACQECCIENEEVGVPFSDDRNHCSCMYAKQTPPYGYKLGIELNETREEKKACDKLPGPDDYDIRCQLCCARRFMWSEESFLGKCKCVEGYKIKHRSDGTPYAVPKMSLNLGCLGCSGWGRGGGGGGFGLGSMSAWGFI